jgi:hypothetical protein
LPKLFVNLKTPFAVCQVKKWDGEWEDDVVIGAVAKEVSERLFREGNLECSPLGEPVEVDCISRGFRSS